MHTAYYPLTRPVRSSEPTFVQEPITVAEARRQCNLSYDDPDLAGWITSARRTVERDAKIICYTGTFTWKMTEFGYGEFFELPDLRPITSITSITYTDTAGASQTWASTNYALSTSGLAPYVWLTYGNVWPTIRDIAEGITVTFVAGYSSVANIPQEVKDAVKLAVHVLFLQRSENFLEAERQQRAYERCIANIRVESYS